MACMGVFTGRRFPSAVMPACVSMFACMQFPSALIGHCVWAFSSTFNVPRAVKSVSSHKNKDNRNDRANTSPIKTTDVIPGKCYLDKPRMPNLKENHIVHQRIQGI